MSTEFRRLPSVDRLLQDARVQAAAAQYSRPVLLLAARAVLEETRAAVAAGGACPDIDELALAAIARAVAESRPSLRPVINATGVIIHTNLGRAPLSVETIAAMSEASANYTNLEFDLTGGGRGSRFAHLEEPLAHVTGAQAGLAVNNNAAALLLALIALAKGKEVIVSRGQAVEIGGGFRIPDVMRQSGARLVEVGTTNRTNISDYQAAIGPRTALLLRVHTSNFRVIGFTESTGIEEMAALSRQRSIHVLDDLGSGALLDTAPYGLAHEPTVQESVAAGSGLVCFSGDKLLGGPQAGIIVGQRDLIERLKRHPLARAIRLDKDAIAGLAATLQHYRREEALAKVPIWQMISAPLSQLEERARRWAAALSANGIPGSMLSVVESRSTVGGGSLPGETMPTWCLALAHRQPNALAARLRQPLASPPDGPASPPYQPVMPVIVRVERGAVLLDPRTVLPGQDEALLTALRNVLVP